MRCRTALLAAALAALLPTTASATPARSTCAAPHSRTLQSNAAVRVYTNSGGWWACAYANGRRFHLGRGSRAFRDHQYTIEEDIRLRGSRVAFVVSEDGVDYTVSSLWLRDIRTGRNLVADASPVVREGVCAVGDDRSVASLLLGPRSHLAWTVTYSCAPGLASYREEVVALAPGGHRRLLDSSAEAVIDPNSLALASHLGRVFWMHGATPVSAKL
jgi:hypothetical protein